MGRGLAQVKGVVRMDGKERAGAMVLLMPENDEIRAEEFDQSVRMDQSDSDGTFALGGIVPGKYVLLASEDGWELEWKDEAVLKTYREKGMKLQIGADEVKKVVVEGMQSSKNGDGK
jgi:hypothetical protein